MSPILLGAPLSKLKGAHAGGPYLAVGKLPWDQCQGWSLGNDILGLAAGLWPVAPSFCMEDKPSESGREALQTAPGGTPGSLP